MFKEVEPTPVRGGEGSPSNPRSWNEAMSFGIETSDNPLKELSICGKEVSGLIAAATGRDTTTILCLLDLWVRVLPLLFW